MVDILKKILKNPTPTQKNDDDFTDDDIPVSKKAVKISNENSSVKSQKVNSIKDRVNEILNNADYRKQVALELTTKLYALFDSKTLEDNKSPVDKQNELTVLSEFKDFAHIINTDPNEQEGVGNLVFITTLCRILLKQRNRLNNLEYEINQMKKHTH